MTSARTCRLDGRQRTKRAVLAKLGRDLGWDGPPITNLDALHDVLARELPGPLRVEWHASPAVRAALGADYRRLLEVLRVVAEDRPDLTLDLAD